MEEKEPRVLFADQPFGYTAYPCPFCGEQLVWNMDVMASEIFDPRIPEEDDRIIAELCCMNCGAFSDISEKEDEFEDENGEKHNMIIYECPEEDRTDYPYYSENEETGDI